MAWRATSQGQASPCAAHLILAGAHHRAGSEMLTRMLGALCKRCWSVRRWKPSARDDGPCAVDATTGRRGMNASALARARRGGLRLLSSGQWAIAPPELARVLGAERVGWRMAHLVRDPFELVLSAFYYHLDTTEPWAHVVDPPWYARMRLAPPLPRGSTYRQQLRSLNATAGVVLQAQHSLRGIATMAAVAEGCAALPERCTNLWLHDFQRDFDAAAARLLAAIGLGRTGVGGASVARASASAGRGDGGVRAAGDDEFERLLGVLRRAGRLSDAQRRASAHVTAGKHGAQHRLLSEVLQASAFGPQLRRLQARLQGERPPCVLGPAGASGPPSGGRAAAGGWWASDEPVHTLWLAAGTSGASAQAACCDACRAAVEPPCLWFNHNAGARRDAGPAPAARCTLLTSRSVFHPSRRARSGEV